MALVNCSECGREISDQAPSCPNCGFVVNQQTQATKVDLNFNKYELTSKKWKKYKIIGFPLLIIGLIMFMANLAPGTNPAGFVFGLLFTLVGVVLLIVSSLGNWWDRG